MMIANPLQSTAHRPPAGGVERGSGARRSTSEDERKRRLIGTDIARAPTLLGSSLPWFFSRPVAARRPCLASSLRSPLRATERGSGARGAAGGDTRATRATRVRCGWFFTAAVEQGRSSRAVCSSPPPPPWFFSRPVRRSVRAAPSLHSRTRAPARGGRRTTSGRADARRARHGACGGARRVCGKFAFYCCRSSRSARRVGCVSGLVVLLPSALRKRRSARHRPHRRSRCRSRRYSRIIHAASPPPLASSFAPPFAPPLAPSRLPPPTPRV